MNEIEIIKKLSTDKEVFSMIIDMYENKLLKYILKITDISLEEAENLLQEVFLKVYLNIFDYDEKFPFSSWIYRITHNVTIDYYRKYDKKSKKVDYGDDDDLKNIIENIVDEGNNPSEIFAKKELKTCVKKSISSLHIQFREILVLKFIEGKDYNEISDILMIPVGTVGTLINRGKKQLKEIIIKNKCI
ncbi:MAG: sigma-70 family RNA polymerase sigma factor [Candidatus Gracilibacteria bacterium]|nr:sigma-70 family RNA polymerase sigma factor [Candidatus Gracilibacteria bacterium]